MPHKTRKVHQWEEDFKELPDLVASPSTAFSPTDAPAAQQYQCEVDPPILDEVCSIT